MDTRKTGTFICILRKQKGLTQSQLAERIGVTDKALSRWETGKGFPDVSLLQPLAEALDTSVTELLAGEPLTEEEKAAHSDSALLEALRYAGGMGRRTLCVLLTIAGVWLFALPLFLVANSLPVRLGGLVFLLLAWLVGSGRLSWPKAFGFRSGVLTQKGAALASALALAAALVLELLPWGAVLVFGRPAEDGTIGRFRETFSYFSLTPAGYANFFPPAHRVDDGSPAPVVPAPMAEASEKAGGRHLCRKHRSPGVLPAALGGLWLGLLLPGRRRHHRTAPNLHSLPGTGQPHKIKGCPRAFDPGASFFLVNPGRSEPPPPPPPG